MTGTPLLNGVRRSLFQKYKCANSTFVFLSCGTHDIAPHIDYRYHEAIAEMIVCVYNLSERSGGYITKCALIYQLTLVCALSEGSCRRLPQKQKNAIRILCFMRQAHQQYLLFANICFCTCWISSP